MSANSACICAVLLKYCSRVKRRTRRLLPRDLALGDADAGLVRLVVVGLEKLHRVRGHHRQVQARGQLHGLRHVAFIVHAPGALQLDVETVREDAGELQRHIGRALRIALHQRLAHRAGLRARDQDQARVAFLQPVALHQRLAPAIVARPGAGEQLAEVQVTLFVLHQQQRARHRRLLAARHGTGRFFGEALQQHLGADDGLDARAAGFLVELDGAEQVAEIGDGQRGLAVGSRRGHHVIDAVGAVDDGEFGVQAQMGEHRAILEGAGPSSSQVGGGISSLRMLSTSERNSRL
jgi:hypothetical protein